MLRRSNAERRLDRNIFRRSEHVFRNPAFRLAGKIFLESDARTDFVREMRHAMQKSRPVGLGFANYDQYGPDESWSTPEDLRYIHGPGHYIVGENHGFSFGNPE